MPTKQEMLKMKKERKINPGALTKENKRIIMKIEHYLETRYINEIAGEEILSDIVGMALECQERGDSFAEMIGDDHESFCRELIKNSPKQFIHERILSVLHWFLLFAMLLLPGLYIVELALPQYSPGAVSGLVYTVKLAYILKYYILMFVIVIGWFFVRMYTYKPTKYVFGAYFAILMLLFLFTDGILAFIVGKRLVKINVLVWLISLAILLIICDLVRRIIAMTIAYKRRKCDN